MSSSKKFDIFIPFNDDVKCEEEICQGLFSIIKLAEYKRIKVAVKIPKKSKNLKREISINEIGKHIYFYSENVISFRGIIKYPNEDRGLIMDYVKNGNLHEYLLKNFLTRYKMLEMSIDIAKGLLECHEHGIIHLNINSENILVDENSKLKIAGFGFDTNGGFDNIEAVRWAAPERLLDIQETNEKVLKLSDIYSCGLVMWEIAMNGEKPFYDIDDANMKNGKSSYSIDNLIDKLEEKDTFGQLKTLIKKCCNSNPSGRPALVEVTFELESLYYIKRQESLKGFPDKEAIFYFTEEKYEDLIQHLTKLLDVNESTLFALKYRALEDLHDALEIEPNYAFALRELEKTYQTMTEKTLKINEKWHSILGKELRLIEPHYYAKLDKIIPPPKLSSNNKVHGNVAAVLPYIQQKVKMWGVDILNAENFNKSLKNYDEKDEVPFNSESNCENMKAIRKNRLSRFDCIATLFASAECTVAQDIFQTISQFPIAFPLLIPELDSAEKYKVMLPLFTGPTIKWKTSNGIIIENHLFEDSFKMIVAVRIGTNSKGKSTIINQLMNSKSTFTSCFEPGAKYGIPYMINGSIEFVWLIEETCGDALWNNVFKNYYDKEEKEIVLLANLHGDALDYPDQINFLKQFTSCFLVFLMPGYNKTQKNNFETLVDSNKIIYNYVDPENKDKKEKYTIYTNEMHQGSKKERVCDMFKNALDFSGFSIDINSLKIGKTLQFVGKTEFPESKSIINIINDRTCRHIKLNIMTLQKKQFEDESNYIRFWQQTTDLQKLIQEFANILALPIDKRRQVLAHLEREISRLSMEKSYELRNDAILKKKELKRAGVNIDQEKEKEIREEITKLWEEIDNISLGIDHFFRELGHIYRIFISDFEDVSKIIPIKGLDKAKVLKLPEYCAELLISGSTIELFDGDSATLHEAWFLAICNYINKRFPKLRVFVINILGLQSSEKSILLNALFACKVSPSVERRTKGLFMRLLFLEKGLSNQLSVDAFILIDTEGLGAPGKIDETEFEKNDRMLATFAIGISNLIIINMLGESTKELIEILKIVQTGIVTRSCFERVDMSPDILMVQHVAGKNATKLSALEQEFWETLQKALEIAKEKNNEKDNEIGAHNFECLSILNARIKNKKLKLFASFKNGLTAYSPPSKQYHKDVVDLYKSILNNCKNSQSKMNFSEWYPLVKSYWHALIEDADKVYELGYNYQNGIGVEKDEWTF
ncbi:interferon-induced very large GTPase 1-like [Gigaspora margarita]|uniref:Interferon-induced very large GTPase 1-like n=1 Tax=Gigaspora margarita TaxID=4874 RepID=A0A8H3XCN0_GIGMA|nr:interferon-induced very large GTPase 1-like [Gigaspora margarita]